MPEKTCEPVCVTCPDEEYQYNTPFPDNKPAVEDPNALSIGLVTEEVIDGKGQFDKYMRAAMNQLNEQYKKGRIVGKEYANAYIAMHELMMTQANQYVLGKYKIDMEGLMVALQLAEMKLKGVLERNLLTMQVRSAEIQAELVQQQVNETIAKTQLICEQRSELVLNGEVERRLKEEQIKVATAQVALYAAQAKGFADKNRNDTFKNLMNAWAVHASEVDPDSTSRINQQLYGINLETSVIKAKNAAGL